MSSDCRSWICRACRHELEAEAPPSICPICREEEPFVTKWQDTHDRLRKPAPAAIERDEKRAGRETTYRKASTAVRARDGFRCRLCGDHRALETHHVTPRSIVGRAIRDTEANLITLCHDCHQEVTKKVIKLYPGPDGANGLIRAERYSKPHKDWLEVRREA